MQKKIYFTDFDDLHIVKLNILYNFFLCSYISYTYKCDSEIHVITLEMNLYQNTKTCHIIVVT